MIHLSKQIEVLGLNERRKKSIKLRNKVRYKEPTLVYVDILIIVGNDNVVDRV